MNKTTIDSKFVCCATCQYWNGKYTWIFPGTIVINQDENTDGVCTNTYFGAKTQALASCSNWKQRSLI